MSDKTFLKRSIARSRLETLQREQRSMHFKVTDGKYCKFVSKTEKKEKKLHSKLHSCSFVYVSSHAKKQGKEWAN